MSRHSPDEVSEPPKANGCPIVGVGASAGGLEAFIELIQNLPAAPGMAFVLVQHLDPRHASLLPEILARESALPVALAEQGAAIEKDRIYVIPPNSNLAIADNRFALTPRQEGPGQFMPIDHFFRSLAMECGGNAIGVVLSGGGTDGALGLEDIKGAGGIVFVQDESTARQTSMPRSAATTGQADFILSPAKIGQKLGRLAESLFAGGRQIDGDIPAEQEQLHKIFALLRRETGVDFALYKHSTLKRRIHRRIGLTGAENTDAYAQQLADDPAEVKALAQDFLIRVTSFFRDPGTFVALQQFVASALHDRASAAAYRVWVAGCSTGEEVYSIAITLLEALGDMAGNTPMKILATDINESALEKARSGVYVDNIAIDVSPERLRRFFDKVNGSYQICKAVRDLCVFSKHNLAADPPFANIDLVSCRNLLIYFDVPLQNRVLPYFQYALRPGGLLVLGSSETIGGYGNLFETRDKEHRIYSKKLTAAKMLIDFPAEPLPRRPSQAENKPILPETPGRRSVQREAERVLLSRYALPNLLIDEDLKILHFGGEIGPYLNPTSGTASLDLLKMVRDSLIVELRDAIDTAKRGHVPVRKNGLSFRTDDRFRTVAVEVVPLRAEAGESRHFIVVFNGSSSEPAAEQSQNGENQPQPETADSVRQLERELTALRQHQQSLIEENDAANEELKAANEEILSSNEELQSTNEELQTSKEEMQSANEELGTVNDELQHRNSELRQLNDDLVNLLGGLNIPIIMVSRELRIRRFTASAEVLFNLIPSDIGRHIGDLRPNLQVPNIVELISEVIKTLKVKELDVQDQSGHWYSLRIRPYVTSDNRIDGAAIAVVDIDVLKAGALKLKMSRDYADAIVETVWEPLLVLDREMRVNRANAAFFRTFQLSPDDVTGHNLWEIAGGQWDQPVLRSALEKVLPQNHRLSNLEIDVKLPDVGELTLVVNAHRIYWEGSGTQMVLLAMEDVSLHKKNIEHARLLANEQAARAQAEAANRAKDEFLAMLAHELRNPLAPIRSTLDLLGIQFGSDPVANQALAVSQRQIVHMARILDDLLDVSRITRGKITLRREVVEVQGAVSRAVAACQNQIESRQHELTVSLPEKPIYLLADPARLEQILVNLLTNAAKYTPSEGRISIDGSVDRNSFFLRVRDNGVGISRESLPHIFDLFMQADRSLAHSEGGLGIGLTLVKSLVTLHGGSIEAFSDGLNQGSEFVVRLPMLGTPDGGNHDRAPQELPAIAPRRILVVDDNPDVAATTSMVLRVRGHQVETVENAAAAQASIAANKPDVLLLDIGLPGMDGYELARQLRTDPALAEMTIIAVTGYGQEEDRRRSEEAGINHHLVKPIDVRDLDRILAGLDKPAAKP
jgi:two-component system CheB/CheR fusion protein